MNIQQKRYIEVFSAGYPACESAIQLVNRLTGGAHQVEVHDMHQPQVASQDRGGTYADGVYNLMGNVLTAQDQKPSKAVNINLIAVDLYTHLKVAQNCYKLAGYSGLVVDMVNLKGGKGVEVIPLLSPTGCVWLPPQSGKVRLSSYDWSFELDTATLYDETALNQFFSKIIRDISWGLGIPEVSQTVINSVLQYYRWLAPAPSNP